jgi:microcystin-dependent protein
MQVKVYTIDVRFPRWLKRAIVFSAIPTAVLLGAVHYLRADATVPNTFADGDTLSAAKMNASFNALQSGINTLSATVATLQGSIGADSVPPGTISAFGGQAAPAGWLLCDGSAVKRTDYPGLFTAIGTTWGAGDGTTFNVPDLRGRGLFAASASGTFATVGATGGSETHTHTVAAHSHTVSPHHHAISTQGDHVHTLYYIPYISGGGWPATVASQTDPAGSHNHTGATSDESPLTDSQQPAINAGSSLPPYAVITYIIKG